jgi:ProQ/FINO family
MTHDPTIRAILELLAERWPSAFSIYEARRRPLKIGVHLDILAALDDAVTADELGRAACLYRQQGLPQSPRRRRRAHRARWRAGRRRGRERDEGACCCCCCCGCDESSDCRAGFGSPRVDTHDERSTEADFAGRSARGRPAAQGGDVMSKRERLRKSSNEHRGGLSRAPTSGSGAARPLSLTTRPGTPCWPPCSGVGFRTCASLMGGGTKSTKKSAPAGSLSSRQLKLSFVRSNAASASY